MERTFLENNPVPSTLCVHCFNVQNHHNRLHFCLLNSRNHKTLNMQNYFMLFLTTIAILNVAICTKSQKYTVTIICTLSVCIV